ncbi:hypothetical protein EVAR_82041_1 [Eumeta japonica]|uniref:Uncharacterized protein n=1 Tax=Eumeta variegata TaxID=151549 RepID=A0A4C1XIB5_EUMVA|nr:hypothetical protein EVAR_82041_1 [Eumeta japonica]
MPYTLKLASKSKSMGYFPRLRNMRYGNPPRSRHSLPPAAPYPLHQSTPSSLVYPNPAQEAGNALLHYGAASVHGQRRKTVEHTPMIFNSPVRQLHRTVKICPDVARALPRPGVEVDVIGPIRGKTRASLSNRMPLNFRQIDFFRSTDTPQYKHPRTFRATLIRRESS